MRQQDQQTVTVSASGGEPYKRDGKAEHGLVSVNAKRQQGMDAEVGPGEERHEAQ